MDAIVGGLVLAGLFALVGQGLALTFITTRTLNFGTGEMLATGAFLAIGVGSWTWLPTAGKLLFVIIVMGVLGGLVYRFLIIPFAKSEHDSRWLLSTVGLSYALMNLLTNGEGANPQRLDMISLSGTQEILGSPVSKQTLLIAIVAVVVAVVIAAVSKWTSGGLLMRAVAIDSETVSLMGASPRKVGFIAYAVATAIAGVAGVLWGAQAGVTPSLGFSILVSAFAATVIGGLTSLWGPLLGAVLFTVVSQVVAYQVGALWGQVAGLLLVVLVLIVRPEGLLGRRMETKL